MMSRLHAEWLVVGGWAVDLFVGHPTRQHDDVDIGLARDDQLAARRLLAGWRYEKVLSRGTELSREPWPDGEWLALPVHEVHAHSPAGQHVEFLLLERDADNWVYRRDPRVTRAWVSGANTFIEFIQRPSVARRESRGIEHVRAWVRGEVTMTEARTAAGHANAAARDLDLPFASLTRPRMRPIGFFGDQAKSAAVIP